MSWGFFNKVEIKFIKLKYKFGLNEKINLAQKFIFLEALVFFLF